MIKEGGASFLFFFNYSKSCLAGDLMKTEKIIVKTKTHDEAERRGEACEAALLYLLRKYCEECVKLDCTGISEGVHRGTGRERVFDESTGE